MKINREILRIAVPSIISNITVPLLGLVDLAIAGHMGDNLAIAGHMGDSLAIAGHMGNELAFAGDGGVTGISSEQYLAAISVGSTIFNIIYWLMGFLRMGTSGMTSQAYGARDEAGIGLLLRRSLTLSLVIAGIFLVFQLPLRNMALDIIHPSQEVWPLAATYFNIVIWGAPAMLSLYSLNGWFIGMQDTKVPMMVAIFQNVVNVVASLLFVFGLGMKIEGVALGTLVAQWSGVVMALGWLRWKRRGRPNRKRFGTELSDNNGMKQYNQADNQDAQENGTGTRDAHKNGTDTRATYSWRRFFSVNRDIFLRTVCLVAVNLAFTSAGARQGDMILAVNTLLMTFYTLFSYVMDGFAYAGEALAGKYYGAKDSAGLKAVVKALLRRWGLGLALLFTLLYAFGGRLLLYVLTNDGDVIAAAGTFSPWTWLIPLAGFAAFVYDGIYIGLTATRGMLISSFVASLTFFIIVVLGLVTPIGEGHTLIINHFLWLAFIAYLAQRGIMQYVLLRRSGLLTGNNQRKE